MNPSWVNAIGLVYRDSRPEKKDFPKTYKQQLETWNLQVNESIERLRKKCENFDEAEFRERTMRSK